jgi:HAD superfamily hydrolase (TIGR01509 family)
MVNYFELLQRKRLLIFDFDGTVADTSHLHAEAFSRILEPLGAKVNYDQIAGLKTLDAIRKCLNHGGFIADELELAALVVAKQNYVRHLISHKLHPKQGVDEFVRWAKLRYKIAMVSSGSAGTVKLALRKLGYIDFFDPLICAEDVEIAKPSPEGFLTALERTGVLASEALIFEDSEIGFQAAKHAGVECIDIRHNSWPNIESLKF